MFKNCHLITNKIRTITTSEKRVHKYRIEFFLLGVFDYGLF